MIEGIQSLDPTNVEDFVQNNNGMIIFHKTLCPHCKVMGKVLLKVKDQNKDIAIAAIDTEEEEALKAKFGVERVPTIVVVKNGEQKASKTAVMNPKEILAYYKSA